MLYLVPTPIGNLKDITLRALDILKDVDLVLAEDTRQSKKLLNHYEITTPLRSFHAHNEHSILDSLIGELTSGKTFALVSDAGTPAISDPGFLLVRACRQKSIPVICLPGATAFVPALAASGIPCDKFFFEGFLPTKKGRKTRWEFLKSLNYTVVLYESPHRIVKALTEIKEHFGPGIEVSVARELSKIYEEIITADIDFLLNDYSNRPSIKGEFVIIISKE